MNAPRYWKFSLLIAFSDLCIFPAEQMLAQQNPPMQTPVQCKPAQGVLTDQPELPFPRQDSTQQRAGQQVHAIPARPDSAVLAPADSLLARDSSDTVVMRFAGDLLLAGHYEAAAQESSGIAFDGFDLFLTDDISMVNHECAITSGGTKVKKPYNFRMRPAYVEVLPRAGIDLVNLANNHIYDYGKEGLFDTISYLDSIGVLHVGAGRNEAEARKPVVLRVKGRKIGFVGYYGGGEAPVARRVAAGVAPRSLDVIAADVRALRDSVDYLVVTLHWGTEKATRPDAGQQAFARRIIDAGADAVIGHHPHVLQGIERYRQGVIVYSLGNFVFGGNSRDSYDTALFEIRLSSAGAAFDVIPLRVLNWRVRPLGGEAGNRVRKTIEKLSSGFNKTIFTMKEKP